MSKVFALIISVIILFLLILSLTKIKLRVLYRKQGKNDRLSLEMFIWRGLFSYKLEIPVVEMRNTRPGKAPGSLFKLIPRPAFKVNIELEEKDGRLIAGEKKQISIPGPVRLVTILINIIRLTKRYGPVILQLFRRIHLRRFQWRTRLGTGDPSHTGFITGLAWGLKGALVSVLYRLFASGGTKPFYKVVPDFENACFSTVFDCIFEVRVGYIMLTGFKALLVRLKIMIGG